MQEFEKIYSFANLYEAYRKARLGKRWKEAAIKFEVNLFEALHSLSDQLQDRTYTLSPYYTFKVYEPKERTVMSNGYKDRVIQHSLCDNVLEPTLTKTFIYDNSASQVGKGTDFAMQRIKTQLRHYYFARKAADVGYRQENELPLLPASEIGATYADGWVLKCDIRKYFYNIPHDKLKQILARYITDEGVLWLLFMIIDSTEGNVGIPIGNQSSQILALVMLSALDHYIKEELHIMLYGRYMDDFYLIHEDREYLKTCREKVRAFVGELGFELNDKTQIFPLKNGIEFLGFHYYLTDTGKVIMKLRQDSKTKMRRRLRKFRDMVTDGVLPFERVLCSYCSWKGHATRGNTYHLIQDIDSYFKQLFGKELAEYNKQHKKEDTKMSTAKERLDKEISELSDKKKKLDAFIGCEKYQKLTYAEQYLLKRQGSVMAEYIEILRSRQSLFKEVE